MAIRRTYKQELIKGINKFFRNSNLLPIPQVCLEDMSTVGLVEFSKWLAEFTTRSPMLTPDTHQLPPKRRG